MLTIKVQRCLSKSSWIKQELKYYHRPAMSEKNDHPPESRQPDIDVDDKKRSTTYLPHTSEEDITESSDSGIQDSGPTGDAPSPDSDPPVEEEQRQGSSRGQKMSRSKAALITFALCVCI